MFGEKTKLRGQDEFACLAFFKTLMMHLFALRRFYSEIQKKRVGIHSKKARNDTNDEFLRFSLSEIDTRGAKGSGGWVRGGITSLLPLCTL